MKNRQILLKSSLQTGIIINLTLRSNPVLGAIIHNHTMWSRQVAGGGGGETGKKEAENLWEASK